MKLVSRSIEREDLTEKSMESAGKKSANDPFQMLIDDHKLVKRNFEAFEKTEDEDEKYQIFTKTVLALVVHTKLEEELVYPLLKEIDDDLELEAEEEHRCVDFVITEMKPMSPDDEKFDAKFKVLSEMVKHHIKEEEEEAFPKMRKQLQNVDFSELADQMAERKLELEEEYSDLESVEPLQSKAMQAAAPKKAKRGSTAAKGKSKSASAKKPSSGRSSSGKTGGRKSASTTKKKSAATATKKQTKTSASTKKKTAKPSAKTATKPTTRKSTSKKSGTTSSTKRGGTAKKTATKKSR